MPAKIQPLGCSLRGNFIMDKRCYCVTGKGTHCRGIKYSGTNHQLCFNHYKKTFLPLRVLAQVLVKKGKTFDGEIWSILRHFMIRGKKSRLLRCPGIKLSWTDMWMWYGQPGQHAPPSFWVKIKKCDTLNSCSTKWCMCCNRDETTWGARQLFNAIINGEEDSVVESIWENKCKGNLWGSGFLEKIRMYVERNKMKIIGPSI